MKIPRISIGSIMASVALVAINFAVYRACYGGNTHTPTPVANKIDFMIRGALPMANALAIGLLLGLRRRTVHPALPGFESFGALALALYMVVVITLCDRYYLRHSYVVPAAIRQFRLLSQIASTAILVVPQLAFALIGGHLSKRVRSRRIASSEVTHPSYI